MPEARELRSVIEAAEQAASAGDFVAAELHLREAAALQEIQLGPFHADLANTLNNLGVVYERADSPAEAEMCYRRAYAIATTVLASDHAFVVTSRKNLEDFCKARGRSFEPSTAPRERVARRKPVGTPSRPIAMSVLAVLGLGMLFAAVWWLRSSGSDESSPTSQTRPSAQNPEPTAARVPLEANPGPQQDTTQGKISAPPQSDSSTARGGSKSAGPENSSLVTRENRSPATAPIEVTMTEAQLCRRLSTSDWRCEPVSSPVNRGSLFFYTRVSASSNTTVEHRWYRDDRLRKSVELRIQASPGSGYRTYSRHTLNAENAGNWRVELRTKDGVVLHEERFVVR